MRVPVGQPAVTEFVLAQLHALSDETHALERMAVERVDEAATTEAMGRLRRRLSAHVLVLERLLISPLRGSAGYGELLPLEGEHDALEHRAALVHASGCPAPEVAALGRALRAHIAEESRLVRSASAAAERRLVEIPPWRAHELFECAGGPTDTFPGEWLG